MAQKLEAKGGKGGNQWDDLLDHDNIAKIHVQGGHEGIQYVKFDYVKFDNLKIGQPKLGSIHGLSRKGFTQTFEIDPTSEYIVSVEGYYDESKGIIQALKFKTNKKTSDMIGYDENGLKFSLEVKGKAIVSFHGFADTNLNSLGAYFAPAPPTKFDYQGGSGAQLWDDGSNYNGVRKVSFSLDDTEIRQIRIEYDKGGLVEKREYGSNVGRQEEFVLDYPTEYIIYMEGTCDIVSDTSKNRVRSVMFKTSKGRTSPIFGKVAARKFVFESNGSALIGFHGRAAAAVDAIGAYFSPLILSAPAPPPPPAEKLQAKGGNGGNQWDDLADHDHVTKIYVQGGQEGIQYVKFDYVKNGQPQSGSVHGLLGRGFTQTFEIDPTNEHLVSVEGYYDESKGLVQGLKFKTNKKTSDMIGYDENGLKFSLEVNGKKIIGFHGYAQTYLNSLGAYFVTAPPTKFDYQGGSGAQLWDDGTNYNGVRKISFALDANEIRQIRIDYDKGGLIERREYGGNVGRQEEFVVDYPSEYIIYMEGTCDIVSDASKNRVRSLMFKTSKGRTSPIFGKVAARKFVFESNGSALIGFHGRAAAAVDAIGAYFSRFILPPSAETLQAKGGEGGDPWSDGVFNGVRNIYVGQGENGVSAVKFVYDKDSQVAEGNDHGKPTLLGYEEFKLEYPSEYITTVEGCFDKIFGSGGGVITMLKFKTNKRTSPPFGLETTSNFVLGKEGYKIVGFHGTSSHELHQLGVYVMPI